MAESENFEDYECDETEEEIVEMLSECKIYAGLTSLDDIIETAKKRLEETIALYGEPPQDKQSKSKDLMYN